MMGPPTINSAETLHDNGVPILLVSVQNQSLIRHHSMVTPTTARVFFLGPVDLSPLDD